MEGIGGVKQFESEQLARSAMAKEKTIKGLQRLAPFKPKSGPTSDARQTAQRLPMVSTCLILPPLACIKRFLRLIYSAHGDRIHPGNEVPVFRPEYPLKTEETEERFEQ